MKLIQDIVLYTGLSLFLLFAAGRALPVEAQTNYVVCGTPNGNEIIVRGTRCPSGTWFIRVG